MGIQKYSPIYPLTTIVRQSFFNKPYLNEYKFHFVVPRSHDQSMMTVMMPTKKMNKMVVKMMMLMMVMMWWWTFNRQDVLSTKIAQELEPKVVIAEPTMEPDLVLDHMVEQDAFPKGYVIFQPVDFQVICWFLFGGIYPPWN